MENRLWGIRSLSGGGAQREGSEEAAKVLLVEKGLLGSLDSSLDGSAWRRSGVLGKFQG